MHALAVLYQCLSAVLKVGRNKKIRGDIKNRQRTFLVCVTFPCCYWISACCCYPCLCTLKTVRMHSCLMQCSIMTYSKKKKKSLWINNLGRHLGCSVFLCQGVWTWGGRSASQKMWWWRSSTSHPIGALECFWKDRRELRGSRWRTLPMMSTTPAV